eukprot:g1560.t1
MPNAVRASNGSTDVRGAKSSAGAQKKTAKGGAGAPSPEKREETKSESEPTPPLEVEFGPGSIGLELVPKSGRDVAGGAVVKSVTGVAEAKNVKPKMQLMLVNGENVSQLMFQDLMKLLSKSGRPIKMTFQGR